MIEELEKGNGLVFGEYAVLKVDRKDLRQFGHCKYMRMKKCDNCAEILYNFERLCSSCSAYKRSLEYRGLLDDPFFP